MSSRRRRPSNYGVTVRAPESPSVEASMGSAPPATDEPYGATVDPADLAQGARRPYALLMILFATIAIVASGYLTWVKLAGGVPVCGPISGCETVQSSPYSELFGIPIAVFGFGMSLVVLGASIGWWRRGDRRMLYAAYALGLMGLFVVAFLTFLELFVIHAICAWCATFGLSVVLGWVVAAVAVARVSSRA